MISKSARSLSLLLSFALIEEVAEDVIYFSRLDLRPIRRGEGP